LIAIGADHGGFILKKPIIDYLIQKGFEYIDFGVFSDELPVDYPDIVKNVCEAIITGNADKGILLCGTGIGVSIAANKYHGIRAALCTTVEMAKLSRQHNNANVITLGGRITQSDSAVDIIAAFLDNEFDNSESSRHARRVEKINKLDTK